MSLTDNSPNGAPAEPDLKGLSRAFVLKVMAKCAEDHDKFHCRDVGIGGSSNNDNHCPNAELCTIENCNESEFIEDEDELIEAWAFVHSPGGSYHHRVTVEMVSIHEVIDLKKYSDWTDPASPDHVYFGAEHTIEMCYTNGTQHEWRALYGVREETDLISIWMD